MLLGFKRRFEPYITNGSKTHTIRAARKGMPKVGDRLDCYVDPRQKTMRLLGRWLCVKVEEIIIDSDGIYLGKLSDRHPLDKDEIEALAFRDGFRDYRFNSHFEEMMKFWKGRLPFHGYIIHWDFSKPQEGPRKKGHSAEQTAR